MPQSYFPLRWESTGDQWWYASPIDWAAANGHYEVVRELLYLDTNLLIKLTSLRRIRRLETVWDDDARFVNAAKCRSSVARSLLLECENKNGRNTLIRAGYGGWLLYSAASAGDMGFVQELLQRDPLLVFGEGEYGVTDILYAAARSKNSDAFRILFDFAVSPKCLAGGRGVQIEDGGNLSVFRWEMVNRAVHAAARGGNLRILRELLGDYSDALSYRDSKGSTVLHAASGRGQVEVVKDLVTSFNIIIESRDNHGNTALHVAAFRGHLSVVEVLIVASPSSSSLTNSVGDTFLHMAVAGFRTPGFRRLDRQMELMKHLICGSVLNIQDIINMKNNDGRTVLHMAVIGNVPSNLVELLMTVQSIDLNARDVDGMTPMDLLSQPPRSASSEILIKQLVSAGGVSSSKDYMARSATASQLKMLGIGNSPGTSFRISDAEIFLYTGVGAAEDSERPSSCSSTSKSSCNLSHVDENHEVSSKKKRNSVNSAARRLKILLGWPRGKERKTETPKKQLGDESSSESIKKWRDREDTPTPLRQRFSKPSSSLANNKRILSVRTSMPSPVTKKKFSAGLIHGVIEEMQHLAPPARSPSSSLRGICEGVETDGASCSNSSINVSAAENVPKKQGFVNRKLMNRYLCFGAQGLTVEDPLTGQRSGRMFKRSVLSAA